MFNKQKYMMSPEWERWVVEFADDIFMSPISYYVWGTHQYKPEHTTHNTRDSHTQHTHTQNHTFSGLYIFRTHPEQLVFHMFSEFNLVFDTQIVLSKLYSINCIQ